MQWRERLIGVLEPRNDGLVKAGQLICMGDKPRIVSGKYAERVERMKQK
jgi:hypothetical protein